MAEFKDRLDEAMTIQNLTAAELSRVSGVNEGAISQYRAGKYKASQRSLDKLARALNVSIPWLMGADVPIANEQYSSFVRCPDCGLSYNSDDEEEVSYHESIHQKWQRAVDKFGFCWTSTYREQQKANARNKINSGNLSDAEYIAAQEDVFRALFSRSLEASNYNIEHVDFETYVSMLLHQSHWKETINTAAYEKLVKKYGTNPGIESGTYYLTPKEKLTTILSGEQIVLTKDSNPDIIMIARAGKKMTKDQAENLRKYAQYMFPEAFADDT